MCDFISWIEKDGQVYYLTYRDIYNTRRGKELRNHCMSKDDLSGHGAIRYYYDNFTGGAEKECTDFTTPANFPPEIVEDIKAGKFRGLGINKELLTAPALKLYEETEAQALKLYKETKAPAWKLYEETEAQAWKLYEETKAQAFWDIFKIVKNRKKLWR